MVDIIIGDEHARGKFRRIYDQVKDGIDIRYIICTGDYFDPYVEVSFEDRLKNFEDILTIAKTDQRVRLLLGNHDCHYLFETGEMSRADFQNYFRLKDVLFDNRDMFKIAVQLDDEAIVSHAGISPDWCDQYGFKSVDEINYRFIEFLDFYGKNLRTVFDEMKHPDAEVTRFAFRFFFRDQSGWGDHFLQPPTWIRPSSLLATHETWMCKTQIVGHTRTDDAYMSDFIVEWPSVSEVGAVTTLHPAEDEEKSLILVDTGEFDNYLRREVKEEK